MAASDVNGDSKPDLITANGNANTVGVFLNNGNGTFTNQTTYPTGASSDPTSVAVIDVNGDSKPDIIVVNRGGFTVGVLFNTGNGTFGTQTIYSTGASSLPSSVSVVDVNNDNKSDIISLNGNLDNVGVLYNRGNGTFTSQTAYSTGSGSAPRSMVVADVNNDGKPDIITGNYNTNNIGVLLNTGNGTFTNPTTYPTGNGSNPNWVTAADINNDSKPDIIVSNSNTNNIGILFNIGNGTFNNQTTYSIAPNNWPTSVAVGDVNGDSIPDIVATIITSASVDVFLGIGNGIFTAPINYIIYAQVGSLLMLDVNSDNKLDLVVTEFAGNVRIFLNQC